MDRKHKIAIIGTTGFQKSAPGLKIDCFYWNDLEKITNLSDYDAVVLSTLSITKWPSEDFPSELEAYDIDLDAFRSKVSFQRISDLLYNHGQVIVVGRPDFKVRNGYDVIDFLDWTGMSFTFDTYGGDIIEINKNSISPKVTIFLNYLNDWEVAIKTCNINSNHFNNIDLSRNLHDRISNGFIQESYNLNKFCSNRSGYGVAFEIRFSYEQYEDYGFSHEYLDTLHTFGPIIFLPKVNLPENETIQLVLRDFLGISTKLSAPGWIESYSAPGQAKIDQDIQVFQSKITALEQLLSSKQQERSSTRACLQVLYEKDDALEEAVWNLLEMMGAIVERPEKSKGANQEDGWIKVQIGEQLLEGVLEIKGTKKQDFNEDGIKQLGIWKTNGLVDKEKEYKGIFIGNNDILNQPSDRPNPFNPNWQKKAEKMQIVAITTSDLFDIYCKIQGREVNPELFWNHFFESNGVFTAKQLTESLQIA